MAETVHGDRNVKGVFGEESEREVKGWNIRKTKTILSRLAGGCSNERLPTDEVSERKEWVTENQQKAPTYSWMLEVNTKGGMKKAFGGTKETAVANVNISAAKSEKAFSQLSAWAEAGQSSVMKIMGSAPGPPSQQKLGN